MNEKKADWEWVIYYTTESVNLYIGIAMFGLSVGSFFSVCGSVLGLLLIIVMLLINN